MGLPKTYRSASLFSRGSSYDVQKPNTDHDPTANLLNYDDVNATAQDAGGVIGGVLTFFVGGAVDFAQNILDTILGVAAEPIAELSTWVGNILSIPANIIAGFTGGTATAGPFSGVFDTIFGLLGIGQTAQASADNANVGVAQLEAKLAVGGVPGGVLIDDTFNRTGTTPGADYTVTFFGPGVGGPETNGSVLFWNALGGGDRGAVITHNTPLATEYQSVAFVTDGPFPVITNSTHLRLIARSDGVNNWVEALITNGTCKVNIVVGGVITTLDTASITDAAGDRWTLKVGTDPGTGDVREFILYQNTTPVITVTDTGGTSHYGPGFMQVGVVMYANTQFIPPFFFTQNPPPSLQSFTANDRPAAA